MPALILAIIFLGLILGGLEWLFEHHGALTLLIITAAIGFFALRHLIKEQEKELEKRREAAARKHELEEQSRRKRDADQKALEEHVLATRESTLSALEAATKELAHAEASLKEAMSDFKDRAFYPFWDNLEASAIALRSFSVIVGRINSLSDSYKTQTSQLSRKFPSFPINLELARQLKPHRETIDRVNSLARRAHKDFEFSSIFATRKTNKILVEGFSTLAQALEGIRDEIGFGVERLVGSLDDIERATRSAGAKIEGALGRFESRYSDSSDAQLFQGRSIISLNEEAATRQKAALGMLDNIQKGRTTPMEWTDLLKR